MYCYWRAIVDFQNSFEIKLMLKVHKLINKYFEIIFK